MPNASPNVPNASILLIGDPGSGKTSFLAECPKPLLVFDCDKNARPIRRLLGPEAFARDVTVHVFKDASEGRKPIASEGQYAFGTGFAAMLTALNKLAEQLDKGERPYATVAVDSFSALTDLAMNQVLKASNHKKAERDDYGSLLSLLRKFTDDFVGWPGLKVLTAHMERATNATTGELEKLPLGIGSFPSHLARYFNEVYYLDVERKPAPPGQTAEEKRVLITQQGSVIKQAKSTFGVPNRSLASYKEIAKYLED